MKANILIFYATFILIFLRSNIGFGASYGLAGCGLGSIVANELKWEQEGPIQIFAATSNGLLGSQTFGISMGTSNCGSSVIDRRQAEQQVFLEYNMSQIKKEAAAGNGAFISAFAGLMGCQGASGTDAFLLVSQMDYSYLFLTAKTDDILQRYQQKIAGIKDCAS